VSDRSRARHVLRSLIGGIAVVGASSLVLTGLAAPASALDAGLSGTLTINQVVDPVDDAGLFNLQIDGSTAGTGANAGNGGTTGAVTVSAGAHAVGQTAGTDTDLGDYEASTTCTADGAPVALDGDEVLVGAEEDVVCTITLIRVPITVVDPHPTVKPNTQSDRCASSRGRPSCDDDEPIVEPEVEDDAPPSTTTTAAPVADPDVAVAGEGDQVAVPAPVDQVLAGEVERAAPAPAATLPRTGTGIGRQVTLAFGLMGAGIVSLALARRRRPAAAQSSR
jgi:hypothetical protein